MDYSKIFNPTMTPQTKPIPGMNQVKNNAGGYGFDVGIWKRLERFLSLGSEGGSYYVGEAELTIQNGETIMACIREDGLRTVSTIVATSESGRAHKNDPAIFALALCAAHGDPQTKRAARVAIPSVCRTGTFLFQFMEAFKGVGGKQTTAWKKGVSRFYTSKTPSELALQLIKYRQRNGWTHRDVLRLAHAPGKGGGALQNCLRFAVDKPMEGERPVLLDAFAKIQTPEISKHEAAKLIREHNLPWEAVPTHLHKEKAVWEALIEKMPYTATMRNLGRLGSLGFFGSELSEDTRMISKRLADPEIIKKARVHPFSILLAYSTYMAGHGVRGDLSWTTSSEILDALESAFFASFSNVVPTGKPTLVGVDCSGSMTTAKISNTHLSAAEAALTMAYIHLKTEPVCEMVGFGDKFVRLELPKKASLREMLQKARQWPGMGTDCSLPFQYAIGNKLKVDTFVIYTDNETWAGGGHPVQWLARYRKEFKPDAKAVDVAMTATQHSISDSNDPLTLAVAGMDATVPAVIADFVRGNAN